MLNLLFKHIQQEKDLKRYIPLAKEAKVFNFADAMLHKMCNDIEVGPNGERETHCGLIDVKVDEHLTALPFPCTAINAPDQAIIMRLVEEGVIEYVMLSELYYEDTGDRLRFISHGKMLNFLTIDLLLDMKVTVTDTWKLDAEGWIFKIQTTVQKHFFSKMPKELLETINENVQTFAATGLWRIMQINTIDRFVLEVKSTDQKPRAFSTKIQKTSTRPHYIILKPNEIRKYMRTESEIIGSKKAGHERRAHNRTYPDDVERFPNAHGKTIRIAAIWVGSTEVTVGDVQYKVILD